VHNLQLGDLTITFHRTVRVPVGAAKASALPPNLGSAKLFKVAEHRAKLPASWEAGGYFLPLWDVEAMWMSFSTPRPIALLVGAGGINAITGKPLTPTLELVDGTHNYLVCPTQPWLDGWKGGNDDVFQFVATPYKKGAGISVGEQILGEQSKTGGLGFALYTSKAPIHPAPSPQQGWSGGAAAASSEDIEWSSGLSGKLSMDGGEGLLRGSFASFNSLASAMPSSRSLHQSFDEMGVGKGGLITQRVYADPHGIDKWNEMPAATTAVYLVDAVAAKELLGITVPAPVSAKAYGNGTYYHLNDGHYKTTDGAAAFGGLKSVPEENVGLATVFHNDGSVTKSTAK
jgi:hypothetical protein